MKHTVTEMALTNGSKGLLVHVPDAQVMTFDFSFRAGDYLAPKAKWETPHIMEHLLLGANEVLPRARLFQAEFEKNGAYCNASTSAYHITYEAECADFEWERILDNLCLAITKPLFLQEEFDAEVGNIREELYARGNNHFRHLSLALREAYGFAALTDQECLKRLPNVELPDVLKHYKKTHTTSNMRFVIAGNMHNRHPHIRKAIENLQLPKGSGRIPLPDEKPKSLAKPLYINNPTVDNLYFYLDTFVLRTLSDPEWDALQLLNIMLTETLHSRILGEARERGLVYSMGSGLSQAKNNVSWWFGAQVLPQNVRPLFDIINHELEATLQGYLSEDDLVAAQSYALGRFQRSGQTVSGVAGGYSNRYFFEDIIDDYYKTPERIKAVTKNGIIDAARTMFADKLWGLGFLGSSGRPLANQLQAKVADLWQLAEPPK